MYPQEMTVPVFIGQGQVEWKSKTVPEPGAGQLLIEVKANALCGSDRRQFYHGSAATPGHEAAGIVVAAGAGTTTATGTFGVIYAKHFCSRCRPCRLGYTSLCERKKGVVGFGLPGGYEPYIVIEESIFYAVDQHISAAEATLLLDMMGTGSHAIRRAQRVHPDIQSVLISGAGPIGLGLLVMARLLLGEQIPVWVADFVPYRLALAQRLGGIPVSLHDGTVEQALQQYGIKRVDAVFDASGKEVARRNGLLALNPGGVLVCVGHGEGLQFDVAKELITPELTVMGSDYFAFSELETNLQLLRKHRDVVSQLVTHRFPLSQVQEAYALFFEQGETGKVVVEL